MSWFKEATLIYDLRMGALSKDSPYFLWLSSKSQEDVRKCPYFYVALLYSQSSRYIAHGLVRNQFEIQKASWQSLSDFERSLRMHPQFKEESLQKHHVRGVCFQSAPRGTLISLPGYPSQTILD
ncbi:MAG: hypothetical protein OXB88_09965 [Bacteriovoracales bacterium]|nr:hypothetical protein [Bacteriovoracales bacterium]